jgi:hypothetical protein
MQARTYQERFAQAAEAVNGASSNGSTAEREPAATPA